MADTLCENNYVLGHGFGGAVAGLGYQSGAPMNNLFVFPSGLYRRTADPCLRSARKLIVPPMTLRLQRRSRPQDRHSRSKTLPWAPGGSRAPDEGFCLEGAPKPKIQREGPFPPKMKPSTWAAAVLPLSLGALPISLGFSPMTLVILPR